MNYLYHVSGTTAEAAAFAWPNSPRERARLRSELLTVLSPALQAAADVAGLPPPADPAGLLDDFLRLYPLRPLADNKGGSGLNDALWLYLLARSLAPDVVVESGTWRGQSSWLLRQACPAAEIWSFDVEIPPGGRHETPGVRYLLGDWSEAPLPDLGACRALVFFDDHVSHARRLAEAAARGLRLAIFDDNFTAWQLHATGAPPVPTLAMLLDDDSACGDVIEWQRNGKIYRYDDREEHRRGARALVAAHLTLPELAGITRHPPGSGMTLVRLK